METTAKITRASALLAAHGYLAIRAMDMIVHVDPSNRPLMAGGLLIPMAGIATAYASLAIPSRSKGLEIASASIFALIIVMLIKSARSDPTSFIWGALR